MTDAQFYTFISGGLALLIAAAMLIAWQLWMIRDDERDGAMSALDGVSHEMRINLQRMVSELGRLSAAPDTHPDALLPIKHPQLDGVHGSQIRANRNALAVISATYLELIQRKNAIRRALSDRYDIAPSLDDAMDATIDGIASLYMWEVHGGARPNDVGRVRTWSVRSWMKGHGFRQDAFPGMFLRDEVVERLRAYGLGLTPRPLTHTAAEYYAMQYDRYADERGPFGRRRKTAENEVASQEIVPTEPVPQQPETPDFSVVAPAAPVAAAASNVAADTVAAIDDVPSAAAPQMPSQPVETELTPDEVRDAVGDALTEKISETKADLEPFNPFDSEPPKRAN